MTQTATPTEMPATIRGYEITFKSTARSRTPRSVICAGTTLGEAVEAFRSNYPDATILCIYGPDTHAIDFLAENWRAVADHKPGEGYTPRVYGTDDCGDFVIAQVGGPRRMDRAVLMAAAPQLLAALADARALIIEYFGISYNGSPSHQVRARIDAAVKAATEVPND
jgi:hypothetical protein